MLIKYIFKLKTPSYNLFVVIFYSAVPQVSRPRIEVQNQWSHQGTHFLKVDARWHFIDSKYIYFLKVVDLPYVSFKK
jgi:hypothetical protein